jgi:hypothetical protein
MRSCPVVIYSRAMTRRSALPTLLLAFAFVAMSIGAWALAAGNDLAGIYALALGAVAVRASTDMAKAGLA